MAGLTAQVARAIFQHLLESARELDQSQLMALLQPGQPQSTLGTQSTPAPAQQAAQPPQDQQPTATSLQQASPMLPPAGTIQEVTLSTFAHLGARFQQHPLLHRHPWQA